MTQSRKTLICYILHPYQEKWGISDKYLKRVPQYHAGGFFFAFFCHQKKHITYRETFCENVLFSDCPGPLELIYDGVCNDEVNNAGCNFDGGDCCGACINTDLCSACVCHTEAATAMDLLCKLYFSFLVHYHEKYATLILK